MRTQWQFKINGIVCEEPIGWDGVEFTLQRDEVFQGLENIFSDNITFWDTGAQIIKDAYELDGIDAVLNFEANYSCDGGLSFVNYVTGILNAFFYEVINNEVKIKIEPSGFHRKVKNRLTTPVNLFSPVSIGGAVMSTINPFDLKLHSKSIVKKSTNLENPFLNPSLDTHTFPNGTNTLNLIQFPFENKTTELETIIEETNIISFEVSSITPDPVFTITTTETGDIKVDYKLKGQLEFTPSLPLTTFDIDLFLEYSYGANYPDNNNHLIGYINTGLTGLTFSFDESGSFTVPYVIGHSVWFDIVVNLTAHSLINPIEFKLTMDPASGMSFSQNSMANPSTAKAFLIHEVFAKLAESMTDETDSFRSNFFGRTNSLPHAYDSNGCGAWTAISNGLSIRKMLDKVGNNFPIVTTFDEFFNSCSSIWNLGMRIEKVSDKEYIRVEPIEFFFNSTSVLTAFQISDLIQKPAQNLIFNNFEIGYDKWNLNITGSNGLDEFNSKRKYSIPVKQANKTLSQVSKIIGSGYLIEQCRRIQYQANPSNDFELDNDLFFICTNNSTVTSSLYTHPPVATSYNAGEVSERDENFSAISNVLSPATCYNLRISPVRNAQRWYKWIAGSIFKHPTNTIKFISGDGNYQETDTQDSYCIISNTVSQNQNLLASDIIGVNALPVFLPETLQFTYPLTFADYLNIINNTEKSIQVSCGNEIQFIGFIKELKYSPNTEGDNASFTLIRGNVMLGDFNDDFNEDFFV